MTAGESPDWNEDLDALMARLAARPEGLSEAEAGARLSRYGLNTLESADRAGPLRLLWRQFESPLVLILVFGSAVAFLLRDWTEAGIIFAIIIGSTALGFAQEFHASRAIEALRQRVALTSRCLRDGAVKATPATALAPGDVILLSAGDLIPADGRILEARDFLVSEATLTGEPFPIEKRPGVLAAATPLAARTNYVFAGASVRSGEAKVLICATGAKTEFGAVAARLRAREPETDFVRGLRRFGYLLLRVAVVLVVFVLTINQWLGRPFLESLLFSVALAVGLSPELLPAIVSVTLSAGARAMAGQGVLVRRLDAIENLGGVTLICTDKTGTLTEGAAVLRDALAPDGAPSDAVMTLAFLNAALETGIENPLDQAIVAAGRARGTNIAPWRKIDEIPYDFERRRLTIVVESETDPGACLIVTKGAFQETLGVCATIAAGPDERALDDAARDDLARRYRAMGEQGLRALAVAARRSPAKQDFTREDERDLCFHGFLTFADPLKADAKDTIAALNAAGVAVKVITGDNRYVAAHVAAALGIDPDAILCGPEIDAVKGGAFGPVAERTKLFAEVDPRQKERIVQTLRRNGHVVGFIGDGVNDAPALHAADVGISVDSAVDVAREAADVLLLRRDLGVLRLGIESGRRAFANTLKYICITTGSSFGNMVSMALATPLLPFLPLTAAQVLLTNFLTDLPLLAVSTDNVDAESLAAPQRWRVKDIQSFMLVFGLLSSVFDGLTFAVLRFGFHAGAVEFQSTWFVVSVLTELAALLVLRTNQAAWKSRPGRWLVLLSLLVAAIAIAAPFLAPVAALWRLAPPPLPLALASAAIVIAYALATEAAKALRRKRSW
jgi:Mg2+-importing ATPase